MKQEDKYAMKIISQIGEMFHPESENYIDKNELLDSDNATAFIHALANIAPGMFYNTIVDEEVSILDFNHIANRLCFQFGKIK